MKHDRLALLASDAGLDPSEELIRKAEYVLSNVISTKTQNTYAPFLSQFALWCETNGAGSLPATKAAVRHFFLALPSRYTAVSIRHFRTVIRMAHLRSGFKDPIDDEMVEAVVKERLRVYGASKARQVLYFDDFMAAIDAIGTTRLCDLRDRAYLLVGYLGPLQLRHARTLTRERIVFRAQDMLLYFPDERRAVIRVPRCAQARFCPVRALYTYLQTAHIREGLVFVDCNDVAPRRAAALSPMTFARIVRSRLAHVGVAAAEHYSTESLLHGFIVTGHEMGVRTTDLMVRTGLKEASIERLRPSARKTTPLPASYLGF